MNIKDIKKLIKGYYDFFASADNKMDEAQTTKLLREIAAWRRILFMAQQKHYNQEHNFFNRSSVPKHLLITLTKIEVEI